MNDWLFDDGHDDEVYFMAYKGELDFIIQSLNVHGMELNKTEEHINQSCGCNS